MSERKKICVFAGTTEGRTIIEFLNRAGAEVTACVATEYGQALLPEAENLTVSARRLSGEEILDKYSIPSAFGAYLDRIKGEKVRF